MNQNDQFRPPYGVAPPFVSSSTAQPSAKTGPTGAAGPAGATGATGATGPTGPNWTVSAPLAVTSGNLAMLVATASVDGYLSHIDWGTFNGKQNALGYTAANDTAVVHLTGTETVTGAKTFSASNTIFQNIGFGGSTPSGWGGGYSVVQNSQGSLAYSSNYLALSNNLYFDGANFRYIANGAIAFFGLSPIHEAKFVFYTAPTGTAGNVATITEVAWVDLNGNASFNGSSLATSHGTPVNALGIVGATATCDFTKSAFNTLTLTTATNCTISFTAPANPCDVTVIVSAPASGTVPTQTWPSAVNGTPAAVSTLGKRTINRFHYDGSRYWLLASLANQT